MINLCDLKNNAGFKKKLLHNNKYSIKTPRNCKTCRATHRHKKYKNTHVREKWWIENKKYKTVYFIPPPPPANRPTKKEEENMTKCFNLTKLGGKPKGICYNVLCISLYD